MPWRKVLGGPKLDSSLRYNGNGVLTQLSQIQIGAEGEKVPAKFGAGALLAVSVIQVKVQQLQWSAILCRKEESH
jgi:hypothetical protein